MSKIDILKRALTGEFLKFKTRCFWNNSLHNLKTGKNIPVIVSLTSYGKRVEKIVPYTILSILKQSVRPEKIILWLNKNEWNKTNLPKKIKELMKHGLTVEFCEDIRSYTKIIPALGKYPNSTIVTIDDDLYYSSQMLEELYKAHKTNPENIICLNFCYPSFDGNNINSYHHWPEYHNLHENSNLSSMLIFPQGFGGVLYPPHSLYKDVTCKEKFLDMAPYADDIWLYIMGIVNKTQKSYVPNTMTKYLYLDLFRQILTKDRLHDINVGEAKNDRQLSNLCEHYNISLKEYE